MGGAASASQTAADGGTAADGTAAKMPTVASFHGAKLVSKFSPAEEAQLKVRPVQLLPQNKVGWV